MKRSVAKFAILLLVLLLVPLSGCFIEDILALSVSDIDGFDLSACVESSAGRATCWELFWDNSEILFDQVLPSERSAE